MRKLSQLAIPYAVWVALMILLPMLLILLYAFTTQGNDIVNFSFTLDHFIRFFTDQDFLLILWRSLVIAFKTTVICVLLGYPIAYFIARSSDKVRNILVLAITLPMWINMLVRTYAWIGILSEGGILQSILSFLGLGISIPNASWGSMLQEAQANILDQPQLAIYPGLLILLTVLSFNILGDVLRSALEPKIVK